MASGIRILLNFNKCRGPLTLSDGLERAFKEAHVRAHVNPLGFSFKRFNDDTANLHSDLTESHCSGGTYLADRHVALEVHMCFETRDNSDLARELALQLRLQFDPADFDEKKDYKELPWESR